MSDSAEAERKKPSPVPTGQPRPTEAATSEAVTSEAATNEPATSEAAEQSRTPASASRPSPSPSPFGTPTPERNATARAGRAGSGAPRAGRLPAGVTPGLLVAAIGALLTFLAAFLTWASVELTSRAGGPLVGGGTRSVIGLQGDRLGKATLVLAIAALVLVALLVAPDSRSWGYVALAVTGGLVVVLAVLDLISISDASDLRERLAQVPGCAQLVQCTGNRSPGVGVYLTIVGGLAVLVGGLLHGGLGQRLQNRRATGSRRSASSTSPSGTTAPAGTTDTGTTAPAGTTGTGTPAPAGTGTTDTISLEKPSSS